MALCVLLIILSTMYTCITLNSSRRKLFVESSFGNQLPIFVFPFPFFR